jgi:glyoxylase-like metal-dependent hydrolase (beta-lactamase superfamily II)
MAYRTGLFIMSALTLGSFRVEVIHAGIHWWDAGAFFGVVPKTMWSKRMTPDELNRLRLAFNCCVVETGRHNVLIETGVGNRLSPMELARMNMAEQLPPLPDMLATAGIDPERIDLVINTHLHFDHCGGNTIADEERFLPAFPRARYVTQRGEWEHAHERHVRDAVSYRDSNYDPLIESGQMELISDNAEIVPGIELEVVPGHNRDMMIVRARSGGETFCFLSDLAPTVHHAKPTWIGAVDLFPLTAIDNKTRVLTRAAAENWWCAYAHDADTSFSRIVECGGKLEAVECQP